ncbi:MAG: hypothetical protein QOF02_502 [Blastocatellia bacterium]|nr:hypothetical protein [Blastocatellia bacterium]
MKPIKAVIDRIEDGGVAVLLLDDEAKTKLDLPVSLLPEGSSDGDHLKITITQERASREAAEERVRKMQEQLTQSSGAQEQKDFKL